MSTFFKSNQTTAKYHFEKQLKEDTRKRLAMYLLTTTLTGIERVNILKRLEAVIPSKFPLIWAKLPGNILMNQI